ncbi:MAG: hypothetical protein AABW54_04665 [Candidatus Micrarchaeota archaeon]
MAIVVTGFKPHNGGLKAVVRTDRITRLESRKILAAIARRMRRDPYFFSSLRTFGGRARLRQVQACGKTLIIKDCREKMRIPWGNHGAYFRGHRQFHAAYRHDLARGLFSPKKYELAEIPALGVIAATQNVGGGDACERNFLVMHPAEKIVAMGVTTCFSNHLGLAAARDELREHAEQVAKRHNVRCPQIATDVLPLAGVTDVKSRLTKWVLAFPHDD